MKEQIEKLIEKYEALSYDEWIGTSAYDTYQAIITDLKQLLNQQ